MEQLINVNVDNNTYTIIASVINTSIIFSCKIKHKADMRRVLAWTKLKAPNNYAVNKRTIDSMVTEWRAHNLLYALHIERHRTGHVDLELNVSRTKMFIYRILSALYFHS